MDYDDYKIPRLSYKIHVQNIDEDSYAIHMNGQNGQLADIVRKNEVYIRNAEEVNFKHLETIPMKPSKELILAMPKYKAVENHTFFNLMRLQK